MVGVPALTELCAHGTTAPNPGAHTRNQKRPQSDNGDAEGFSEVYFKSHFDIGFPLLCDISPEKDKSATTNMFQPEMF